MQRTEKTNAQGTRPIVYFIVGSLLTSSVVFIFLSFEWKEVSRLLKTTNLTLFIFLLGVLTLLHWMIRALRWRILLGEEARRLSSLSIYFATAISTGLALLTPAQSGDLLRIELLRSTTDLDRKSGYATLVAEKLLDFIVVIVMTLMFGFSTLSDVVSPTIVKSAMFFIALCSATFICMRKRPFMVSTLTFLSDVKRALRTPSILICACLLTVLDWAVVCLSWQWALESIAVKIDFATMFVIMCLIVILGVISLIPGGLGVAEVGLSALFMTYGLAEEQAQASALILRSYGLYMILLGLVHLLLTRIKPVFPGGFRVQLLRSRR